jgi:hypothetical protein
MEIERCDQRNVTCFYLQSGLHSKLFDIDMLLALSWTVEITAAEKGSEPLLSH